ncbi:MotB family protein [Rhizobiaceae bacterium BDR2-2]|uniref:MotB family protein n=1 Tax=Ectorhizobium quercum TaxID=2965071 RepID=A0AAE3SWK0_9HYPH|nr:MotB family protein [Ectorhizobium quercum]MCX8996118.1 MotB family protein [Ectorhizobium quercum]MCX8998843.1 MotB family protein [Ectorhizobium quercum]
MSESESHHHGKNEIIVIKKHRGDHDGHHGGAWKIAYADFMTAMMAFFLVMWLVNAANEETKASVASYFNPIKLSDDTPAQRGLKQPSEQADGEQSAERSKVEDQTETEIGGSAATGQDMAATSGDSSHYSEADLFQNPYAVLAEIAQEVGQQANVSARGEGGAANAGPATGASGGEAYRDPFDPDFWSRQVEAAKVQAPRVEDSSLPEAEQTVAARQPAETDRAAAGTAANAGEAASQAAETAREQRAADDLGDEIRQQLTGVSGRLAEGLVVTPSEGGLLVTISDRQDGAMFAVGSAVPQREMVLAMERIGNILKERQGQVVIRGHTDGRPFTGRSGDNWSLSMDRAHAAYFMLVRGGLDEKRIEQVSGFADRRLQVPNDPFDPANRRIEILLQDG